MELTARFRDVGPSWLAGAIAAGPATMASLVTAGAAFGYDLLWVVILSAFAGTLAQYLAMRLGLFTETGIVSVVDRELGGGWKWLLVVDAVLAAGLAQLVIMKTVASVSAAVTGIDARVWGVAWALILALGLAGGGYRLAELGAKVLVSLVVLAFVVSLAVVPHDPVAAVGGLVPVIPAGARGAVVAAGILGGAVHITLITMHSYTMRARGWTREDYDLALFDVRSSMLVAFGIYSLAIFLVAASVLHAPDIDPATLSHLTAAKALGPLVGPNAKWLFLLGLWGAAVSTLGGNTVVPPYLVADAMGWETDVSDSRYRGLLVVVALLSGLGVFLGGAFFPLLVLVLAFGLLGTPFALVVVLYLLNDDSVVPETTPVWANAGGLALVVVASALAVNSMRDFLQPDLTNPLTAFVVLFALVLGGAMAGLGLKYATR